MADEQQSITGIMNKPLEELKNGYEAVQGKISDVTGQAGQAISDLVRPPVHMDKAAIEREHGVANAAGQFALDPSNFIAPAGKALAAAGLLAHVGQSAELASALEKLKNGALIARTPEAIAALEKLQEGAKAAEGVADFSKLAPSLQNLNQEGILLVGANPAAEFKAAARATEEAPVQAAIQFQAHKARSEAKKFAVDAVKAELEGQPALKRDPAYLKDRIETLFNFYMQQKK